MLLFLSDQLERESISEGLKRQIAELQLCLGLKGVGLICPRMKMATGGDVFSSGGLKWSSRPVVFHRNTGKRIKLSENNTVATRVTFWDNGIVFTSEPVSTGQMLKVTVMERESWAGDLVSSVQYYKRTSISELLLLHRALVSLETTQRAPGPH